MVTRVSPSTSNINDRLQCRRHLKAEESGATAGRDAPVLRAVKRLRRLVRRPRRFRSRRSRVFG
jgi:hypothetical protein